MKILIDVTAFCNVNESRQQQRDELLRSLQTEYCDTVSCKDAYLAVDWCTEDNFIFGSDAPETIREAAENWNTAIETRLWVAIAAFQRMPRATTLYNLKKAVMAAGDDLFPFADEAVLIPEEEDSYYYMHPKLHDDQYRRVVRNPANFAIVEVAAK